MAETSTEAPNRPHHYLFKLSYNGKPFCGWQSQPHGRTVQDTIETAMGTVLEGKYRLVPASRTDTGVHALQQFASFRSTRALVARQTLVEELNAYLTPNIYIHELRTIPLDFHPNRHSIQKIYCYRIKLASKHNVARPGFWNVYRKVDSQLLKAELNSFVGTHDFTSFCAADSERLKKVRTISAIDVEIRDDAIHIWFTGPGFLKQMIRIIVGSAVDRATSRAAAPGLIEILEKKSRLAAGRTAPADGLFLARVSYGNQAPEAIKDEEFDRICTSS